ncbi:MAG: SusC/RagA family TonB-linked outer membrane protein, partial [Butyricimonas faecihominis]
FSVNVSQTYSFNPKLPELTGKAERRLRLAALKNFAQAYYDYETNTYKVTRTMIMNLTTRGYIIIIFGISYGRKFNMPIYQDSLNPFYNNSTNLFKYYFRTVMDANIQLSKGYSTFYTLVGHHTEKVF